MKNSAGSAKLPRAKRLRHGNNPDSQRRLSLVPVRLYRVDREREVRRIHPVRIEAQVLTSVEPDFNGGSHERVRDATRTNVPLRHVLMAGEAEIHTTGN